MASKTTRRMRRTGVVLALGLSGCGVEYTASSTAMNPQPEAVNQQTPTVSDRAKLTADVQQSLDRLDALQLFTVDRLVLKLPVNTADCYGVCPSENASSAHDAELARQAARLAKLVDQAAACNSGNCYIYTPDSAEEAVQAINALEIIQVRSLVVTQPQNNPSCYDLPCESDIQAANRENKRRAVTTFTIASYAQGF